MFQLLKFKVGTTEPPLVIGVTQDFASAVGEIAHAAKKGELRPLVNHAVAILRPYETLQSWEVRIDGERTALLAINEVE